MNNGNLARKKSNAQVIMLHLLVLIRIISMLYWDIFTSVYCNEAGLALADRQFVIGERI